MKKLLASLGVIFILSGCGNEVDEPTENATQEDPVEDVQDEGQVDEGEEAPADTDEQDTENEDETDASESEEITFVPQQSDIDAGLTVENDEVLMSINDLVESSTPDDIGFDDDITIQFTGLYFEAEDRVQPIFAIANRTDEAYTNIDLAISFGMSEDELIFDEEGFGLTEDEFGVLEPDTVMPLYLDADPSQLDLLEEIAETRQEVISIDNIDFDTVGNQL